MRRAIATILICSLFAVDVLAIGGKKTVYVGGTIEGFNKYKRANEGELDLTSDKTLIFKVKGQAIDAPYDRITALDYQKTSKYRHALVGATIGGTAVGALAARATRGLSLLALPALFVAMPFVKSKDRKRHYLTVTYRDAEDKTQVLILELGKEIVWEARAIISARSGIKVKVITEEDD